MNVDTFKLGPYLVRLMQEPGRGCPLYYVYLSAVRIGASLSMPDLGCCRWLEDHQRAQTGYAFSSAPLPQLSVTTGEPGTKPKRSARYLARRAGG